MLLVKDATYQKAEPLRADYHKVSQDGQQQVLNSLQNVRCSFIFITLLVHTTTPSISNNLKISLPTSATFQHLIPHLLLHKIILPSSIP